MHELDLLRDMVVVLGSAVVVVAVLSRIGLPSIAGYILTGIVVGPKALGLIANLHQVEVLAEVGVVLLLFGVGLELSLDRLRALWRAVLIGGGLQVAATTIVVAAIGIATGLPVGGAIFLGCVISVSSTAVVLRGLAARGELEAPHGRLAVGILVFQDLCVVPMVLLIPFLAGDSGSLTEALKTTGVAVAVLVGVLATAAVLAPRVLMLIARTRERDLFVLSIFLICFGTAWIVSLSGISLALGAFLAGLVVAGSQFRHQALSEIIPAREVFAALFFVSVGMLLDVSTIAARLPEIAGLLAIILVSKLLIVSATALLLRSPLRVAVLSGAILCQVGEFSFVLLSVPAAQGLLPEVFAQNLLVAIILSMLVTPLFISVAPHVALTAARIPWMNKVLDAEPPGFEEHTTNRDHVIVAGYGPTGQSICRALKRTGYDYVVVDINPDNVRAAHDHGHSAVFGDVTQREVLEALGCHHAACALLLINDYRATRVATEVVRTLAPEVPIVVRARFAADVEDLLRAGATRVVSAEEAASAVLHGEVESAIGAATGSVVLDPSLSALAASLAAASPVAAMEVQAAGALRSASAAQADAKAE